MPQIFVFTNTLPNYELMSGDRWNTWEMTPDYEQIRYVPMSVTETLDVWGADVVLRLEFT